MNISCEKYFESGPEITLPGIEEKITLPKRSLFRFDPSVPCLAENLAKTELIIKKLKSSPESGSADFLDKAHDWLIIKLVAAEVRKKISNIEDVAAYCFNHRISDCREAFVIAIRAGLDQPKHIFACGHESGELLQKLGHQQTMQKFVEQAGIDLDVSRFSGEDFADIGGMLALQKVKPKENSIGLPQFNHRPPVLPELQKAFGYK